MMLRWTNPRLTHPLYTLRMSFCDTKGHRDLTLVDLAGNEEDAAMADTVRREERRHISMSRLGLQQMMNEFVLKGPKALDDFTGDKVSLIQQGGFHALTWFQLTRLLMEPIMNQCKVIYLGHATPFEEDYHRNRATLLYLREVGSSVQDDAIADSRADAGTPDSGCEEPQSITFEGAVLEKGIRGGSRTQEGRAKQ